MHLGRGSDGMLPSPPPCLPARLQVACFDTTFHRTLPPEAYTYALPADLCSEHRIRKYGEQAAAQGPPMPKKVAIILGAA